MADDRERTACCGLYCGDCIPAQRPLFEAARRLSEELEKCQFEEYAAYKSRGNPAFGAFGAFRAVLDAISTLPCPATCFHGGGRPDCPIRTCARGKGMEGCWQCPSGETCALLEPLAACHGDTVQYNLRMIRQLGADNWAHARGLHYTWQKSWGQQLPPQGLAKDVDRCRIGLDTLPWESPAAGVRFKRYAHNGQSLRLAEFTKEFVEPDWCRKGHIGYVLEGVLAVDFHGKDVVFVAGDGLFIPPGREHRHKARVITESVLLVLVDGEQ